MSRSVIINADDFGFSAGVSDGIVRAHREGVLTSTTLMVTMPDRDRAIELARQNPTLGVGLHLTLTQGAPLTRCTRLWNAEGMFVRRIPALALRLLDKSAAAQAEAEWDAQVRYALERGLRPTHLDSHKHVHHLPALQKAIINVARRYEIAAVRAAREFPVPGTRAAGLAQRVLIRLAHQLAARLARHHLRTTDHFFGLASTGKMNADTWRHLLNHLPEGVTEVMVHPGNPAGLTAEQTRLIAVRQTELDALLEPTLGAALREARLHLIHFGQVAD